MKIPRRLVRSVLAMVLVGCSAEESTEVACGPGVICASDPDTGVRRDAAADLGAADRTAPNDLGVVRDAVAIREVTRIDPHWLIDFASHFYALKQH